MFDTTLTHLDIPEIELRAALREPNERKLNSVQGIALGVLGGGLIWLALGATLFL